jgi:AcrR family transcriptional regulator
MVIESRLERPKRAGSQGGVRRIQAAATRAALIAAARERFSRAGYHATATTDLVAFAGVTRGALYHHFADKEGLFEAVFRQVADELSAAAGGAVAILADDPWRQLLEGLQAYLRLVAQSQEVQRILLLDGPAVFGWTRWRALQSEYTFGHLVNMLRRLMDQGLIEVRAPEPLGHLMLAALNDAAMSIAHARDPQAARLEAGDALSALVEGLRLSPISRSSPR